MKHLLKSILFSVVLFASLNSYANSDNYNTELMTNSDSEYWYETCYMHELQENLISCAIANFGSEPSDFFAETCAGPESKDHYNFLNIAISPEVYDICKFFTKKQCTRNCVSYQNDTNNATKYGLCVNACSPSD